MVNREESCRDELWAVLTTYHCAICKLTFMFTFYYKHMSVGSAVRVEEGTEPLFRSHSWEH